MKTNYVLAYQRVSTVQQENERQKMLIDQYCNDNNLAIYYTIAEKESGLISGRGAYTAIPAFFGEHIDVKYLIIDEISRLGRTFEVLPLIERLNKMKVCTIIINLRLKTLDVDGNEDTNVMQMLANAAGASKAEITTLKRRMATGKQNKALQGNAVSSAVPLGYSKIDKKLVVDADGAALVNEIFKMYAGGKSALAIAKYLNSKGIPTPKAGKTVTTKAGIKDSFVWIPPTVLYILKNPIYTGSKQFKRIVNKHKVNQEIKHTAQLEHLRIVDDSLFNEVQARLKNSRVKAPNTKYQYLFDTGVVFCSCGELITIHQHTNNTTKANTRVYVCRTRLIKNVGASITCSNPATPVEALEQSVLQVVLNDAELKHYFITASKAKDTIDAEISEIKTEIVEVEKQIKNCENDERYLLEYALKTRLSPEMLDEKLSKILAEKQKYLNKIDKLQVVIQGKTKLKEKTQYLVLNSFDPSNRVAINAIFSTFINRITITPTSEKKEHIIEIIAKNRVIKYRFNHHQKTIKIINR